jgi:hypothetical protein
VYVQFLNSDHPEITSDVFLAEVLPVDKDAAADDDLNSIGDDNSLDGSMQGSPSERSLDRRSRSHGGESKVDEDLSLRRFVVCRRVNVRALGTAAGGTISLRAMLSRNRIDFTSPSPDRIICHEFTPRGCVPNCVPFLGQREVIVQGAGFFPLGMQAAISIVTVVGASAPAASPEKKSKKKGGKAGGGAAAVVAAVEGPADSPDGIPDDARSLLSVGSSVGSSFVASQSPAFNVVTVPVRFDSYNELAVMIPPLEVFVKAGVKLPKDMPGVLEASILFCLESDPSRALSRIEVPFYFYTEGPIEVTPAIIRKPGSGGSALEGQAGAEAPGTQRLTLTGRNNWLTFQSNAAKVLFSNQEANFLRSVDAVMVSAGDGTFMIECALPLLDQQASFADLRAQSSLGELEDAGAAPPLNSLKIALLVDGKTAPDENNTCSVTLFGASKITGVVGAAPKDGFAKGASVTVSAVGLIAVPQCTIRLRGVNSKSVSIKGNVGEVTNGAGNITFVMPESLEDVEPNVKGKEKTVYIDVSIDGITVDNGEDLLLPVKY